MKKIRFNPHLWLLIGWFYGGMIYIYATLPFWFSWAPENLFSAFLRDFPSLIPVLSSFWIIIPIIILSGAPVFVVAFCLTDVTNCFSKPLGFPPDYFRVHIIWITPLLVACCVFAMICSAQKELREIEKT